MKKLELNFKTKILPALKWFLKHYAVICIVSVLALYSWLVININLLDRREPDEDVYTEKLQTIKKPTISDEVIKKLTDLEDNNVEIRSLFKQARDNPFQE